MPTESARRDSTPPDMVERDGKEFYLAPEHGWTCFHCGETFHVARAARIHFGAEPDVKPGCLIKVEALDEKGWLRWIRNLETIIRDLEERGK